MSKLSRNLQEIAQPLYNFLSEFSAKISLRTGQLNKFIHKWNKKTVFAIKNNIRENEKFNNKKSNEFKKNWKQ